MEMFARNNPSNLNFKNIKVKSLFKIVKYWGPIIVRFSLQILVD